MLSNVDRMVAGERAGLECKTANSYQLARWKDGAIPAQSMFPLYGRDRFGCLVSGCGNSRQGISVPENSEG